MFYFALHTWPTISSEWIHHSTALSHVAMLMCSTDRKTLQCYDSSWKEFSQQHSDDALQVMSLAWHTTQWLEKTCCLTGIKNNPCEKGQTLLSVNSGSKMTATVNLNRELRRHLGSVQETNMGKTPSFFMGKVLISRKTHFLNKRSCNCSKLFLVFQLDTMYSIPTFIPFMKSLKIYYILGVSIFERAVFVPKSSPASKEAEFVSLSWQDIFQNLGEKNLFHVLELKCCLSIAVKPEALSEMKS